MVRLEVKELWVITAHSGPAPAQLCPLVHAAGEAALLLPPSAEATATKAI